MNSKRMLIYMTIGLLISMILLCSTQGSTIPISFQLSCRDDSQIISPWEDENGCYYAFLPSCSNLEQVKIFLSSDQPVYINGIKLENGMDCTAFSEGIPYELTFDAWGSCRQEKLIFLRSANVATMYIHTQTGNMEYVHAKKGNRESGTLTLYLPDGRICYCGNLASIQGRGNSTWTGHEKKPYSLELKEEGNLLNMGSAQKWVLLANAKDPSSLRNKVIYDFADQIGFPYAPDSDWVDLYLNGEYRGLYLLSERNEVHPERVDISESGSFLVSMEDSSRIKAQKYSNISTTAGQCLRVHYPDNPSSDQLQELKNVWQSVENAILAENDRDPVTGKTWMEQIDLDSWVKKYLIEEVFGNVDACFFSQYFYCNGNDEEKRIYAGPVWDYDQSMGLESTWQIRGSNTLLANRKAAKAGYATPWFSSLYQKKFFYDRLIAVYNDEFLPLLQGFLPEHLESCGRIIAQASRLNRIRWHLETSDVWSPVEYLQTYMRERRVFLNRIWLEQVPYHMVKADNAKGGNYGFYAVCSGEMLSDLPAFADVPTWKFLGWYDSDTGERFDFSAPIYEDKVLQANWQARPRLFLGRLVKIIPSVGLGSLLFLLLTTDRKRQE